MDDYAKAAGSPSTVKIGDRTFKLGKFTPRDLGDLQAFIKIRIPDPRLAARELCQGMSDAVALKIWNDLSLEALNWPPSLESRQGNELLMMTHEGAATVLWVALRRHNKVTEKECAELALDVTIDELAAVLSGGFPEPTFDPKSMTATEPS